MDKATEWAYKRKCFQGRGAWARWLDITFSSALGGVCLYILRGNLTLSVFFSAGLLLLFVVWDRRRWIKYQQKIRREASKAIQRESWMKQEAERIRQAGGLILYPTPDMEKMTGLCLNMKQGMVFHFFGDADEDITTVATKFGCSITFHPWGEGPEPDREQVEERLNRNILRRDGVKWRKVLYLSGNRYLLTGAVLLLISVFLRRALYWRLLGSLCLLMGALRRYFQMVTKT